MQPPVACWDCSALDFHPALPSRLGSTLLWDQVVEVCEPRAKRLLAPVGMLEALHHEQLALKGVVRLIQEGARHRHPGGCKHRIPTGFLLVPPALHPRTIGCASRSGDVLDKVAEPWPQGKPAPACARARPLEQGVDLGAECLTDG